MLRFQEIAERMIGPFLFKALRVLHCSLEVEGIDFVEDGGVSAAK